MSFEIRMPKLSDNMEEGTVIRWIVDEGQSVSAGDPIAEVETDKADVEIEAEESGVISEIVVKEGSAAAVGAVIALLGDEDGAGKNEGRAEKKAAGQGDQGGGKNEDKADKKAAEQGDEVAGADEGEAENEAAGEQADDGAGGDEGKGEKRGAREGEGDAADGEGKTGTGAAEESDDGARVETRPPGKRRVEGRPKAAKDSGKQGGPAAPERKVRAGDRKGDILASPMARELAARKGVDLATVRGSGPGGRIVKADVEGAAPAAPPAAPRVEGERAADKENKRPAPADGGEPETMSRMRRTIAARMEKSKREIPHFYVRAEVDVGDLMELYAAIRRDELVPGLTITHLLLRAIGLTMPDHPRLNALWVDDSIQLVDDVNIGVVVALDDGLLVPVVKRAQDIGLRELVEQTRALIDRTRKGRFRSEDLVGGTISVSNIGMLDVDELTPVINPPQASILGVGAVRESALARDGELVAGRVMTLTLACDHRIVHGVEAGRFLEDLKHMLERPLGLVVLA